jgi:histidyl-tRNA synthetase
MRDIEPEEYGLLARVREAFEETCRLFAFQLMEPSPVELLSTLEAKSGPAIREEIYHFKDKSGRDLGLRFDLTVGLTRYVASKRGLPLPYRVAAFGGMWRYDEPQHGRYRWFHQWDAEIFGSGAVEADAEVVEFTTSFLDRLGLGDYRVEVGDRRVVEGYLRRELGLEGEVAMEVMRALDKVGKKGVKAVIQEYVGKGFSRQVLEKAVELGRIRGPPEQILGEVERLGGEEAAGLVELVDSLKARGVRGVEVNLGLVRGLDYYTSIVFEVFYRPDPQLGAIAGGGRYDLLPQIFGRPDLKATGVAGGVERTLLALKAQGVRPSGALGPKAYICYIREGLRGPAARLASRLRARGVSVELELSVRRLEKQLRSAAAKGARYAVIVAPEEWSTGRVVLRDLERGEEERLEPEELVSRLSAKG